MPKRFLPRSKPPMAKTCKGATLVPRKFYLDPPDLVAQKLLGKLLVRGEHGGPHCRSRSLLRRGRPGAHTFVGKTARNAVLFGPPGHAYVYFIYGMYYCLNVSCEPDGRAWRRPVPRPRAHLQSWLSSHQWPWAAVPGLRDNPGAGQRRRFHLAGLGPANSG